MFKNLSPSALGISGHESEIIELALTYGFAGMDLEVADFATRAKVRGMPYARRLIDSAKIRLGTFRLPFSWNTEDELFKEDMERLSEYARAAVEVDCTRCVATLPPADDQRPYHENFEFHRRRLADICEALQPAGVWFGVGFQAAEYLRKDRAYQFVHDLDALTLLLNMVDAPNMGLLLDIWDLVACGGTIDTIRNLPLGQIVAVQVANMPANVHLSEFDETSRLLPGAENSQIDTVGALIALAEFGYNGPLTPRPSRGIFHSRRRDVIVKQTGEAMERVWRAAALTPEGTLSAPAETAES
ncbi:MAG: sugar phosphate isomerase/epimerase family protein [Planctomycetota bacterium]|jgi:sugar phosphate isomerase/epimerase